MIPFFGPLRFVFYGVHKCLEWAEEEEARELAAKRRRLAREKEKKQEALRNKMHREEQRLRKIHADNLERRQKKAACLGKIVDEERKENLRLLEEVQSMGSKNKMSDVSAVSNNA